MEEFGNSPFITTSRQIAIDNLILTLKQFEKRKFYELKKNYFKDLLSRSLKKTSILVTFIDNVISILSPSEANESANPTEKQKQVILKRLITLADNLAFDPYSIQHITEFKSLEKELEPFLDLCELLYECSYSLYETPEINQIDKKLVNIKSILSNTVKKTGHNLLRDLRQFLRNIIKYFSSQLDDEADKKNELTINFNSFLSLLNISSYGQQKDSRYVRIFV